MKKSELRQLIREEVRKVLNESRVNESSNTDVEGFLNEAQYLSKTSPVYKRNFEDGKEAFTNDEFVAQNPHAKDDGAGYAWMDGWLAAAREAKADEKQIMKFVEQWADTKYVNESKLNEKHWKDNDINPAVKQSELRQLIREEVSKVLNESISIKNDADMIKALGDIAANMIKWKGEEGAHYLSLLTTVIDYIRKSHSLVEGSKPANDATIKLHINTYTAADDPYEVAVEIGKKYNWNQQEIEKAEKIIRAKYIK